MGSFMEYHNQKNNITATNKTSSSSSFMDYHNKKQKEREEEEERRKIEQQKQKETQSSTAPNTSDFASKINTSSIEDLQKEYDKLPTAKKAEFAKKVQETENNKTSLEKIAESSNKFNNTPLYSKKTIEEENGKLADIKYLEDELNPDKIIKHNQAFKDGYQVGDVTKTVASTAGDIGLGVVKGIMGIGENIGDLLSGGMAQVADWVGQDEWADKVRNNIANQKGHASTNLLSKGQEKIDNLSVIGNKGDNAIQGVGNVAGTIALQSIGVPWQVTSGMSSMGSGLSEAYSEGASDAEAWLSAGINAGAEIGSEYLFGGVKLPGTGKTTDAVIGELTDKIKSKAVREIAKFGINALGEGAEEVISGIGSAIGKKLTYMSNKELNEIYSSEQALDDFITGTISSAIVGGAQQISSPKTNIQNTQALQQQNIAPIENIIEQNNTILPKARDSFLETAKQYNIDTNNETIQSINRIMNERGINASFNSELFTDNSQNAIWKISKDENGEVTREVVLNPNSDSKKTLQNIVIHELTHDLEGTAEHNELRDLILKYDKKQINYEDARKSLENIYSKVYDPNSSDFQTLVENEAVADILGNKLGDQEFINNLTMKKPSLGRKIYNWVVDKLNKLTGYSNEKLFWQDVKNKFENAYRQDYQNNNNDIKYSKEVLSDGTKYIKLDNKLFQNQDGTLKTAREAYNTLVGKTLNLDDGTEVKILKSLPKKDLYNELSKRRPRSKNVENISEMNNKINGNLDESIESSLLINTRPDVNSRHIEQGIKNFDTREVYLFDGTGAYRLTLSIAELQSGEKVAYAKKNLTYDKQLTEKIKNELSSSSTSNNGRSSRMITPNNSIASSNENVNTIKYSIQEFENNSGSFSMQDNKGRILTKEQQEYFKDVSQKLRDENGNIKEYYHGTQRADRVGNYFDPNKATSGPMAFFTDNSDIAKSYSENKQDTSISREADTEYDLFKSNGKDLDTYWNSLTKQQQEEINKKGRAIGFDEDYENIVYDENHDSFSGQYDYYLKNEEHNNGIKALYDVFIQDGNLFGEDMAKFKDVLALAGINDVEYLDPYKIDSKVYNVYLKIKNPFDTSSISSEIFKELDKASKHAPTQIGYSADQWDKSNVTPIQWMNRLKDDIENGTTHAWTSIPDWVTNVLKNNGYDGIVDIGGKNGGEEHQVVIPFYSNQIKNIDNLNPTDNPDIRYSQNNKTWQSYLDKNYKNTGKGQTIQELKLTTANNNVVPSVENNILPTARKQTMNPTEIASLKKQDANTTPQLSKKTYKTGNKQSSFLSNIITDSKFLNEDLRQQMSKEDNIRYYEGITNEKTLEKAYNKLQEDGQEEVIKWHSKDSKNATAEDVAEGWILLKQYQDNGDYQSAVEVAKKMRDIGTTAGQTVQAYNILSRLTPEGMFYYAQSELNEAYNKMVDGKSKKWIEENQSKFDLTPEETQSILDIMKDVSTMEDGYDKKVKIAEVQKIITDKIPASTGQSIKAWMRISMLFNPKTQVRNVMGNAVIMPVNMFSDSVSAGIDRLIAKKTGVRTTGNINIKNYGKGFGKGLYESYNDFRKGINTRNIEGNRFEVSEGESFNNKGIGKVLNRVDNLLSFMLDAGDRGFYEATFTNSLNNQMVLNNTTTPTQQMIDIATNEALQRTWQDNNRYTQSVLKIRNILNNVNVKGYGLGDVIIPFAKTPANLTKAIVDYSPAGLVKTLTLDVRKFKNSLENGQYSPQLQHQFVQNLGKATAGTFLYVLSYGLAKADVATGEADDDKDVKNFMKNSLGISSYSIKIGDKSFTYDWAQPIATPLAIMTNYVKYSKENPDANAIEKAINAMNIGTEQLLQQSFMESLNTVLNGNGTTLENLSQAILELPARAIPTFSKQIADMVDSTQRTSFEYNRPIKSAINSVIAKIPIASKSLPASVDTLGNEIKKYGGNNNLWNVMFNPANTNKGNLSKAGEEIYKVYKETGDTTIFPRTAPYYINNKNEKVTMTAEQRSKFQTISGKYVENSLTTLLNDKDYKKLSNEEKANIINEIVSDSYSKAKYDVLKIDSKEYEKLRPTLENVKPATYYSYKFKTKNLKKDNEKIDVLLNSNYTNKEKTALYEQYILSSSDKQYPIIKEAFTDSGLNIQKYLEYKNQEFSADKKDDGTVDGKTVSGSKKTKIWNYIENMNISYTQKLLLYGLEYTPSDSQQQQIINYVKSLPNKTNKEKLEILSQFQGFTIYKDGTVKY